MFDVIKSWLKVIWSYSLAPWTNSFMAVDYKWSTTNQTWLLYYFMMNWEVSLVSDTIAHLAACSIALFKQLHFGHLLTFIPVVKIRLSLYNRPSPPLLTMASQCRQNFHQESEIGINKQINLELYASYVYQSMAYYFDRDDVALPGFMKFFKKSSDEERHHAELVRSWHRAGSIVIRVGAIEYILDE